MAKASWFIGWSRDEVVSWLVRWLWGLPLVTPMIYGIWAYLRGPFGPEVFLGMVVAFAVSIAATATFKSHLAITRFTAELKAVIDNFDERLGRNSSPTPTPTVEMLEAGRRAAEAKREQRIETWRTMIADAHAVMLDEQRRAWNNPGRNEPDAQSATALLESDPRFLSLRRRLTEKTKSVLWPNPSEVATHRINDGSTMDAQLRCVLDDIDSLAKQWGID